MDIGLIILIIIASIIGNIMKQAKRQGNRDTRLNNPYTKPGVDPLPQFRPRQRSFSIGGAGMYGRTSAKPMDDRGPLMHNMDGNINNPVVDQYSSLEGKRSDIGHTYESDDMPSLSSERGTLEGYGLENTEISDYNYEKKRITPERKELSLKEKSEDSENGANIKLKFNEESLINSIIMAEVLGPPKSKRR